MLAEIKAAKPAINIEILGVNHLNHPSTTEPNTLLPWVHDISMVSVTTRWNAGYRDVKILDEQNRLFASFNLSVNDLSLEQNRQMLKGLFLEAAQVVDQDKDGLPDPWEQRHFGNLSATASGDQDNDGFDNRTELAFGSSPTQSTSRPAMTGVARSRAASRPITLNYRRPAGWLFNYSMETSADLKTWTPNNVLSDVAPTPMFDGSGTAETSMIVNSSQQPLLFFRARALPR